MILPIGTIVYLSGGNQKVMILNRGAIVEQEGQDVLFDYTGALFPEGLNPEQVYYFNLEDIDDIVVKGYSDIDEERFVKLYKKWLGSIESSIKKGKTE